MKTLSIYCKSTVFNICISTFRYNSKTAIGSLKVDDNPTINRKANGKLKGIQLYDVWYIGGVPPNVTINKLAEGAAYSPSFVGLIRDLELNGEMIKFESE